MWIMSWHQLIVRPYVKGDWGSLQPPETARGEGSVPALGKAGLSPPPGPSAEDWETERVRNAPTPYLHQLERDCDFGSPHSLDAMHRAFKLNDVWSVVGGGTREPEDAARLREFLDVGTDRRCSPHHQSHVGLLWLESLIVP